MMLGLKINFFKSYLVGINVQREFMDLAYDFLNCNQGSLPFKNIGLPVRVYPRSKSTQEPLLEKLKGGLNIWVIGGS